MILRQIQTLAWEVARLPKPPTQAWFLSSKSRICGHVVLVRHIFKEESVGAWSKSYGAYVQVTAPGELLNFAKGQEVHVDVPVELY